MVYHQISSPCLESVSGNVIVHPLKNRILNFGLCTFMCVKLFLPDAESFIQVVILPSLDEFLDIFLGHRLATLD
jgi:hypothetical protein